MTSRASLPRKISLDLIRLGLKNTAVNGIKKIGHKKLQKKSYNLLKQTVNKK